jgi:hypothetical protein
VSLLFNHPHEVGGISVKISIFEKPVVFIAITASQILKLILPLSLLLLLELGKSLRKDNDDVFGEVVFRKPLCGALLHS